MQKLLEEGWAELDSLSREEYGVSLLDVLKESDELLSFNRVGRVIAVSIKYPFAQSFPYDPELPSNWAKTKRAWEIREPVAMQTICDHRIQFELLTQVAVDWKRPIEFLAEFNIFHWLCKRLRPVVCGEAKSLENAEKIAKDVKKAGTDVTLFSLNQLLGAASVTIATYLVQSVTVLSGSAPLVTGVTLLALCFGQRKLCKLLTNFENSYDKKKDDFANRDFPICGSLATNDKEPCGNRVRNPGDRCWIHVS